MVHWNKSDCVLQFWSCLSTLQVKQVKGSHSVFKSCHAIFWQFCLLWPHKSSWCLPLKPSAFPHVQSISRCRGLPESCVMMLVIDFCSPYFRTMSHFGIFPIRTMSSFSNPSNHVLKWSSNHVSFEPCPITPGYTYQDPWNLNPDTFPMLRHPGCLEFRV